MGKCKVTGEFVKRNLKKKVKFLVFFKCLKNSAQNFEKYKRVLSNQIGHFQTLYYKVIFINVTITKRNNNICSSARSCLFRL